ncbi:hypothetical protein ACFX2J_023768 [Malus domestica]
MGILKVAGSRKQKQKAERKTKTKANQKTKAKAKTIECASKWRDQGKGTEKKKKKDHVVGRIFQKAAKEKAKVRNKHPTRMM